MIRLQSTKCTPRDPELFVNVSVLQSRYYHSRLLSTEIVVPDKQVPYVDANEIV